MNFSSLDHRNAVDQSVFGSQGSSIADLVSQSGLHDFDALDTEAFSQSFGLLQNINHMTTVPVVTTTHHCNTEGNQSQAFSTQAQAAISSQPLDMTTLLSMTSFPTSVNDTSSPAHCNTYPTSPTTAGQNRLPSIENFRIKPQGSVTCHINPSDLFDIGTLAQQHVNNNSIYGNNNNSTAVMNHHHKDHFSPPTVSTLHTLPDDLSQQQQQQHHQNPSTTVPYQVSEQATVTVNRTVNSSGSIYALTTHSPMQPQHHMHPHPLHGATASSASSSINGGVAVQQGSSLKAPSPRKANKASPKKGTRNTNPEEQSKHTLKMTLWSARLFDRWAKWKTEWVQNCKLSIAPHKFSHVALLDNNPSVEELDYWLAHFVLEVKRKDGTPYSEKTLGLIFMGIQRYLNQKFSRSMSIAGDKDFVVLHRTMKRRPVLQEETSLFHEGDEYLENQQGRANSVRFGPPVNLPDSVLN